MASTETLNLKVFIGQLLCDGDQAASDENKSEVFNKIKDRYSRDPTLQIADLDYPHEFYSAITTSEWSSIYVPNDMFLRDCYKPITAKIIARVNYRLEMLETHKIKTPSMIFVGPSGIGKSSYLVILILELLTHHKAGFFAPNCPHYIFLRIPSKINNQVASVFIIDLGSANRDQDLSNKFKVYSKKIHRIFKLCWTNACLNVKEGMSMPAINVQIYLFLVLFLPP